jgi:PII-like signaling protein
MENLTHSVMKIYASTTDRLGSQLLYEAIVYRAREAGISGVTVLRGVMGYGLSSHIHTSKFWELTEKLPVVIEMIDETEKLKGFYNLIEKELDLIPKGLLVTIAPAAIMLHKPGVSGNRN